MPPVKTNLLSLNLFLRPPFVYTNKLDYKDARLNYFIDNHIANYDIICLQEMFSAFTNRQRKLIKAAGYKDFVYHSVSPQPYLISKHLADCGLVILSKYKILEQEFRPFSVSTRPDSLSYKGALHAKVLINQRPLHIFTSHLQSKHYTTSSSKYMEYRLIRRIQLAEFKRFIDDKLMNSEEPAIVLGDMNVDGREELKPPVFTDIECKDDYTHFDQIFLKSGTNQLKDLLREKYGYSPATFGRVSDCGKPLETVLTSPIEYYADESLDYILSSNDTDLKFDTKNTKVEPLHTEGQVFTQISDHAGVQTTFYY